MRPKFVYLYVSIHTTFISKRISITLLYVENIKAKYFHRKDFFIKRERCLIFVKIIVFTMCTFINISANFLSERPTQARITPRDFSFYKAAAIEARLVHVTSPRKADDGLANKFPRRRKKWGDR